MLEVLVENVAGTKPAVERLAGYAYGPARAELERTGYDYWEVRPHKIEMACLDVTKVLNYLAAIQSE